MKFGIVSNKPTKSHLKDHYNLGSTDTNLSNNAEYKYMLLHECLRANKLHSTQDFIFDGLAMRCSR